MHYAEHSIVDGLKLDSLQIRSLEEYRCSRQGGSLYITYEVSIASLESDEAIRSLAKRAADDCFVTNTLKRACTVSGIIIHNGIKIDQH